MAACSRSSLSIHLLSRYENIKAANAMSRINQIILSVVSAHSLLYSQRKNTFNSFHCAAASFLDSLHFVLIETAEYVIGQIPAFRRAADTYSDPGEILALQQVNYG